MARSRWKDFFRPGPARRDNDSDSGDPDQAGLLDAGNLPGPVPQVPIEELPFQLNLRQSGFIRRWYEKLRPIRACCKMDFRYNREFLYDFMPLDPRFFLGRGSYKFVYSLPWDRVVKIGKLVMPSDPLFGGQYIEVSRRPHQYLSSRDYQLMEFLCDRHWLPGRKEKIRRKFYRLALERLHYEIVRSHVPDLVVPTHFFMGVQFRKNMFSHNYETTLLPCDTQPLLRGRHLKEFVAAGVPRDQNKVLKMLHPQWDFKFNHQRFGKIGKKVLTRLKSDLERVVKLCDYLAREENLIIDLHSENLIITLPEFEIKLFDFHLFDKHLYDPERRGENPEKDHIQLIETFMDSFSL